MGGVADAGVRPLLRRMDKEPDLCRLLRCPASGRYYLLIGRLVRVFAAFCPTWELLQACVG